MRLETPINVKMRHLTPINEKRNFYLPEVIAPSEDFKTLNPIWFDY